MVGCFINVPTKSLVSLLTNQEVLTLALTCKQNQFAVEFKQRKRWTTGSCLTRRWVVRNQQDLHDMPSATTRVKLLVGGMQFSEHQKLSITSVESEHMVKDFVLLEEFRGGLETGCLNWNSFYQLEILQLEECMFDCRAIQCLEHLHTFELQCSHLTNCDSLPVSLTRLVLETDGNILNIECFTHLINLKVLHVSNCENTSYLKMFKNLLELNMATYVLFETTFLPANLQSLTLMAFNDDNVKTRTLPSTLTTLCMPLVEIADINLLPSTLQTLTLHKCPMKVIKKFPILVNVTLTAKNFITHTFRVGNNIQFQFAAECLHTIFPVHNFGFAFLVSLTINASYLLDAEHHVFQHLRDMKLTIDVQKCAQLPACPQLTTLVMETNWHYTEGSNSWLEMMHVNPITTKSSECRGAANLFGRCPQLSTIDDTMNAPFFWFYTDFPLCLKTFNTTQFMTTEICNRLPHGLFQLTVPTSSVVMACRPYFQYASGETSRTFYYF
jgi:hypothetical protein